MVDQAYKTGDASVDMKNGAKAVSYTHLDVYKRQVLHVAQ